MTWTELFVCGIALMSVGFIWLCFTWAFDPKTREEAGVKLQGDEDRSIAFVEDYEDAKAHPDQWCEKIVLPQRGRRPEVTIILWNSEDDAGCVWTGAQIQ